MGIIGFIGLGWEIIKLIINIIKFIKELKKKNQGFDSKAVVNDVNAAIKHYKETGEIDKLKEVAKTLKKQCEGVGCASDVKG